MAAPPGSRTRCFRACQGSPTPPGLSSPRPTGANRVAFRVLGARRHPASTLISGLNTLPARSPVNASPQPSPTTTHDSGPVWLAKPSLSETFTPSHLAGFPGAPYRRGSSPRLRGARLRAQSIEPFARFIPAPAGNTWRTTPIRRARTVHPRVCGEHAGAALRGAHQARFIPAPAGNAACRPSWPHCSPVHPRACGEHDGHRQQPRQQPRFIPAPAGNTAPRQPI